MQKNQKPLSKKVGSFLAGVQATVDDLFETGFQKLKKYRKSAVKISQKDPDSLKEKARDLAQKSAGFLGEAGEEYYKKYKTLKIRKEKQGKRKDK